MERRVCIGNADGRVQMKVAEERYRSAEDAVRRTQGQEFTAWQHGRCRGEEKQRVRNASTARTNGERHAIAG